MPREHLIALRIVYVPLVGIRSVGKHAVKLLCIRKRSLVLRSLLVQIAIDI